MQAYRLGGMAASKDRHPRWKSSAHPFKSIFILSDHIQAILFIVLACVVWSCWWNSGFSIKRLCTRVLAWVGTASDFDISNTMLAQRVVFD